MKRWAMVLLVLLGMGIGLVSSAADFNGDGINDIGIFRPSSGLWAIQSLPRTYLGSTGDTPVPGDYNGDGVSELAIFRPSTGLWAVQSGPRVYLGGTNDVPLGGLGGGGSSWRKSGSDIYYTAGKVGIGTTAPVNELDIWPIASRTTSILGLHGRGADTNSSLYFYENTTPALGLIYNGVQNRLYFNNLIKNVVTVDTDGDFGIGTDNPCAMLTVVSRSGKPPLYVQGEGEHDPGYSEIARFMNADRDAGMIFYAVGYAESSLGWGTFSPYIAMHFIPEGQEKSAYEVGDVICAIDDRAVKARCAFDPATVGVICPPEGFISIPKELKKEMREEGRTVNDFPLVPVAYLGNVEVKVNDEGGAITSGDLIVSSSVPGEAMKASPQSFEHYASVIGKAREDFSGTRGLIKVSLGVK